MVWRSHHRVPSAVPRQQSSVVPPILLPCCTSLSPCLEQPWVDTHVRPLLAAITPGKILNSGQFCDWPSLFISIYVCSCSLAQTVSGFTHIHLSFLYYFQMVSNLDRARTCRSFKHWRVRSRCSSLYSRVRRSSRWSFDISILYFPFGDCRLPTAV